VGKVEAVEASTGTTMPFGSGSGTATALPTGPGSGSGFPSGTGMPTMPGSGSGWTGMPTMPGSGSGWTGMPTMPPGGGYGYGDCAPGFLKVCPEMDGTCPYDSMAVCPAPMTMPFVRSLDRMMGTMGSSDGCECVPLVLMQMVMTQQEVMGRSLDRASEDTFEDEKIKVGKKTCTCDFTFTVANNGKARGTGSCDKKCSGNVKETTLNSATYSYTFGFSVKKGKVKVGKVEAVGGSTGFTTEMPGGTGMPGGSGSGMPGGGYGHSGCVCVHMPDWAEGSGMPPMPGSGSGSGSGTGGSGSGGSGTGGSGSGGNGTGPMENQTIPWYFGMNPAELCATPGTTVTFNWTSGHTLQKVEADSFDTVCNNVVNTPPEDGPKTWTAPSVLGFNYFACGVPGHCSSGMKALIEVKAVCPA